MRNSTRNIRSKVRWGIVGIFVVLVVSSIFVHPGGVNSVITQLNDTAKLGIPLIPEKPFKLGLDLQGGAHLVYEADMRMIAPIERDSALQGVRDVIERRVGGIGVSEPQVQTTRVDDSHRLIVDLPGVHDVEQAIRLIGQTPILEFKEENTEPPRDLTLEERIELDVYNRDAEDRVKQISERLRQGESFEDLARELSEDTASRNNGGYLSYIGASALAYPDLYEWAREAQQGDISIEPIQTFEGYNFVQRGAARDGHKQVEVSHILICYLGAIGCEEPIYTKEEAFAQAREVYDQANADNFTSLAQEFSTDPTVSFTDGVIGWISPGDTVEAFENAAFGAEKGQIIGPVETDFGFHVIYKTDERDTEEYEMWRIFVATKSPSDILPSQDMWMNTGLSGKQLTRAEVVSDPQTGAVQVSLSFDDEGKNLFAEITERNLGKPVAIFLDGEPISTPVVQAIIRDGQAVITGSNSLVEARLLAQRLNAGALPVPIELVSQQTIGATLGAKTLETSVRAGAWGIIIVMIFMIAYYRLPGVLAVISLSLYVSLTLALFKLIGVTLTLAGIAGFILSIGMAVDANVLIFERLKEELRAGKSLKVAVEEGFKRAWTSIRDGNLSTLITCALLIWFGTSFVKGFAVTLSIGIMISMFSAITITRVMLRFVVSWFKERDGGVFFMKKRIAPTE